MEAGNRRGRRAGSTDDLILGSKVRFLLGGLDGQASASRVTVPGSNLAFPVGVFPGRDIPLTYELVLQWLPAGSLEL